MTKGYNTHTPAAGGTQNFFAGLRRLENRTVVYRHGRRGVGPASEAAGSLNIMGGGCFDARCVLTLKCCMEYGQEQTSLWHIGLKHYA